MYILCSSLFINQGRDIAFIQSGLYGPVAKCVVQRFCHDDTDSIRGAIQGVNLRMTIPCNRWPLGNVRQIHWHVEPIWTPFGQVGLHSLHAYFTKGVYGQCVLYAIPSLKLPTWWSNRQIAKRKSCTCYMQTHNLVFCF